MTYSPLYGDFPKNNKKTAPHARLKIEEIVESYRQKMVTAKGLILLILKAARRPTKRYRILNVSRFCDQLQISRATFYKSVRSLKDSGDIGVEDKPDELFLWWIDKNAPTPKEKYTDQPKVSENTLPQPISTEIPVENTVYPIVDTVYPTVEFRSPKPLIDKTFEVPSTINTTINTTIEDLNKKTHARENFEKSAEEVVACEVQVMERPIEEIPVEQPKPIQDPYFGRGNWYRQVQKEMKAAAPANENRPLRRWELAIGVPKPAFVKFIHDMGIRKFKWDEDCATGFAVGYITNQGKTQQMEAHYDAFLMKMDNAADTAKTCLDNGMTPALPPELIEKKPVPEEADVIRKLNLVQQNMLTLAIPGSTAIELPALKSDSEPLAYENLQNRSNSKVDWVEKARTEWPAMFNQNPKTAQISCSVILKKCVPDDARKDVLQVLYENELSREFALKKSQELGIEVAEIFGW